METAAQLRHVGRHMAFLLGESIQMLSQAKQDQRVMQFRVLAAKTLEY